MKTTGLNYLEAVKALKEGKCTHIECDKAETIYGMDNFGNILFMSGDFTSENGIRLTAEHFLGEWSLIGIKRKISGTIKWYKDSNGYVRPIDFIHDSGEFKGFYVDIDNFPDEPQMKITLEWEK